MPSSQAIPKSTLRRLRRANWDRLWLQGLVWARNEARRYHSLPRMEREIVQTAIEKTLSGERAWKPDVCDLTHHLRMTIRSLYNSEFKKLRTRQVHARIERTRAASTEGAAQAQERLDDLRGVLSRLRAVEPGLAEFFLEASRLMLERCDTEGEVAAAMGLSPSQFSKKKARIGAIVLADDEDAVVPKEGRA